MTDFVLIHGLNNTNEIWSPATALLPKGANLHAPNLPPLDTVEAVADALLPNLPKTFRLAGYSFGGYVALALLERAPERVETLALVCTTTAADTDKQRAGREAGIKHALAGEHDTLAQEQFPHAVDPSRVDDAKLRDTFLAMAHAYGPKSFVAHQRACMARRDRADVLSAFTKSVLLVTAACDKIVPLDKQYAMREQAKSPRIVEIANAGHLLPIEQPDALAKELASLL